MELTYNTHDNGKLFWKIIREYTGRITDRCIENQENEKGKLSPEKKKAAINLANYFSHTLENVNAEYDFKKLLEEGLPYRASS